MRHFKKIVEERSQGRLQVELYFGGVLGTERELMDYVTMGCIARDSRGLLSGCQSSISTVHPSVSGRELG